MNKYLTKIASKSTKLSSQPQESKKTKPGKPKGNSISSLTMKPKSVIVKRDNLVKKKK